MYIPIYGLHPRVRDSAFLKLEYDEIKQKYFSSLLLDVGTSWVITGALFLGITVLLIVLLKPDEIIETTIAVVIFSVVGILCLLYAIKCYSAKIEFDHKSVKIYDYFQKQKEFTVSEIEQIKYVRKKSQILFRDKNGQEATISIYMKGLAFLLKYLSRFISKKNFDESLKKLSFNLKYE